MNAVRVVFAFAVVISVCGCLADTTSTRAVVDQAAPPPSGAMEQRASLSSLADAPDVSGIVRRGDAPFGLSWVDPAAGMRVVLGFDRQEFCNTGILDLDIIPFQDINFPNGRLMALAQGVVQTTVWGFTSFSCAAFAGATPLASGFSVLTYTDNDVRVVGPNTTNAWGVMAHGTLTRPDGTDAQFSTHLRVTFVDGGNVVRSREIVLE